MDIQSTVIETGVDKLVNLVKERGQISLQDVAKELGVDTTVIQEWVDYLEDEGIIGVEYKLTKPYLVEKKLSKKEVEEKAKEFASKKDIFIRKTEVSLNFLEKNAQDLRKVKGEFDKLKDELGMQLDSVRDDLSELEKYQQLKEQLRKQVEEQKNEAKSKMDELTQQIIREQKRYQELVSDLLTERAQLQREKAEAKSIEESEIILNRKLIDLKNIIVLIEKKVSDGNTSIKNSEMHIEKLDLLSQEIKKHVDEEKSMIEPLIARSLEQERKVLELQDQIIKKISQKQKDTPNVDDITKKVKDFFNKKLSVVNLVDKVNKDRDELEKSLIELIKKAKSFQLTAKSSDIGKEMLDLEKKFNDVNKKRTDFDSELNELSTLFRKS